MPRQDVPYGGAICRLKERIAEIWDKLGEKLHSINGVEGDAAGNVEIVSGDAAITISEDQVNHQIEIALDSSQLPAASVSSVNGQTGAVALTADDIPSDNGDVQTDLDALALRVTVNGTAISNEVTDRQNADSALQTNINAVSASLQGYVTLDGVQTITGVKTVPTASTGSRTQQIANGEKVQNDLDNYAPMVRTTGNQNISGMKIFYAANIKRSTPGIDLIDESDTSSTTSPDTLLQALIPIRANDESLNFLMQFIHNSDGTKWVQITFFAENGIAHAYRLGGVDANGNQLNPQWLN